MSQTPPPRSSTLRPAEGVAARELAFWMRTRQYLQEGYDRIAAARFVGDAAGAMEGPALDVGTGRALLAMALARRGLDVVSVDLSAEEQALAAVLARGAGLAGRIRFLRSDAVSLPFPAGHFGSAAMMNVLHHLDDAGPVLTEMARVVKRGGWIVVADFTEEGFALVARIHGAEGGQHPRSEVTPDTARSILAALGWRLGGEAQGHLQRVAWFHNGS
jgi:ubiquinone/menaquinone biosynthesis C-methylase UbiE